MKKKKSLITSSAYVPYTPKLFEIKPSSKKIIFNSNILSVFFMFLLLIYNCEKLYAKDNKGGAHFNFENTSTIIVDAESTNVNTKPYYDLYLISIQDLKEIKAGDRVIVDHVIDLEGKTVNLPSNISIDLNQGDIVNGTLRFSEKTKISGELLNKTLNIQGVAPTLINQIFQFDPIRWGIKEGVVTDAVARENKVIIQNFINKVIGYGVTTVVIDKMDCYVGVGGNWSLDEKTFADGISLPSNFRLEMSVNTFIRVQPNKWPRSNVINAFKKENIQIKGGNIIGDRYTHDYSPIVDEFGLNRDSHEYGSLISIAGSSNVVVDGVTLINSSGDGFIFASGTHRLYKPASYCKNVTVKNCKIDNSRRNNITIGDGEYLYVENCTITNAGGGENILDANGKIKTYTSAGVAPQAGIDLEAHREVENGVYVNYQIIEHVFIRGNTLKGNYTGDIILFTANDVLIENNNCDNLIGGSLFWNTTIKNNVLTQRAGGVKTSIGILNNGITGATRVYNNKITGNKITGFDTGISVLGKNIEIQGNTVRDFKEAIYIRELYDSNFSNNNYQSDRATSYGYISFGGSASNVVIKNDVINVKHRPLNLYNFNKSSAGNSLTIENCVITSPRELSLELTNNVTIRNNTLTDSKIIKQVNCVNIILQNNN